ncbi:hypothetical protein niasHT_035166 [Heterodera trifolii]|uniref:Tetraspanin n=1 Tax=Heterodera trifolii TaxID=157864 RepID=A0ABD2J311_9BILA
MSHREEPRPQIKTKLKNSLMAFHLFLLVSGVVLFSFALWLQFDPASEFLLRLVHFSESTPFFEIAVYLMLGTSLFIFIAVGIGFSGIWKLERCLLSGFSVLLLLLIHCKLVILILLVAYRFKFPDDTVMTEYLRKMAQNHYHRDKWATPLMDSIQFYHKCCGGSGAQDYSESFWYKANAQMGMPTNVPYSCCLQAQDARAWHLQPIDPMCNQYKYGSRPFNDSVNWTGCGKPTFDHLNWLLLMLSIFLIVLIVLDALGLFLVVKCLRVVLSFYTSVSDSIRSLR